MAKNVLIAEDEWELRNLLKLVLSKNNFDIIEAEDGKQAISLIKKYKPSLILLDNNMPGYTGYGIIQQVKESSEAYSFQTIVILEKDFDPDMLDILKKNVDGFISKPFDEKNILDEINRVVENKKEDTAKTVVIKPASRDAEPEKTVVLSPEDLRNLAQRTQSELEAYEQKKETSSAAEFSGAKQKQDRMVVLTEEELRAIAGQSKSSNEPAEAKKEPEPVKAEGSAQEDKTLQMSPDEASKQLLENINTPRQQEKTMEDTQEVFAGITLPPAEPDKQPEKEQPAEIPAAPEPPKTQEVQEVAAQTALPAEAPQAQAETPATAQEPPETEKTEEHTEPVSETQIIVPETPGTLEVQTEEQKPQAQEEIPEKPATDIEKTLIIQAPAVLTEIQAEEAPKEAPEEVPAVHEQSIPEAQPQGASAPDSTAKDSTIYYSVKGIALKELILVLTGQNLPEYRKPSIEKGIIVIAYGANINYEELEKVIEVFSLSTHIVPVSLDIFNSKLPPLKEMNADVFEISPDAFKKVE